MSQSSLLRLRMPILHHLGIASLRYFGTSAVVQESAGPASLSNRSLLSRIHAQVLFRYIVAAIISDRNGCFSNRPLQVVGFGSDMDSLCILLRF
jgi:hypothetical protein